MKLWIVFADDTIVLFFNARGKLSLETIRLQSVALGELEVPEDRIIAFERGIPGFESCLRYALLDGEEDSPFYYMHSVDDPAVSFVVADPFYFFRDFECVLPDHVIAELELKEPSDVTMLSLVIVSSNPVHSMINLLAPLVINRQTRRGLQYVMHDSAYGVRVPLFPAEPELTREGEKDAGTFPQAE